MSQELDVKLVELVETYFPHLYNKKKLEYKDEEPFFIDQFYCDEQTSMFLI